jgi:hypothetical protein
MRSTIYSFCLTIILSAIPLPSLAKNCITSPERSDGFGAQFQTIIYSAIYAELNNGTFVYTPFAKMEHNYENDPTFITKKEHLINFMDHFPINEGNAYRPGVHEVIQFFEKNLDKCVNTTALKTIKQVFRANKNRTDYFDNEHFHVVIHIRRHNAHDSRIDGTNTSDDTFLGIINKLRTKYASKKIVFHIHSQGHPNDFEKYITADTVLHLNESNEYSFISMVLADALVTSRSSFSYTAGILSEGTVYYIPFWHPPLPHWIPINILT